jgi:dimethylamine/trimethylamine dehydrogenase
VGAGPAGLEAAMVLGKRGFAVSLAEAGGEMGGRVSRECRLPGLAEWARVRDYRVGQIKRMANVALYMDSRLSAAEVQDFGADHVLIATGSHWRADGMGRTYAAGIANLEHARVFTPDDLMEGKIPQGKVTVFDDDHYYMGPVLALLLARSGAQVSYVTCEGQAGAWSYYTGEQEATHAGMLATGIKIFVNTAVSSYVERNLELSCVFSGNTSTHQADALVLVTSREPNDALYRALVGEDPEPGSASIAMIGDCAQPALIAHAVYAGHKAARELGATTGSESLARDRLIV